MVFSSIPRSAPALDWSGLMAPLVRWPLSVHARCGVGLRTAQEVRTSVLADAGGDPIWDSKGARKGGGEMGDLEEDHGRELQL